VGTVLSVVKGVGSVKADGSLAAVKSFENARITFVSHASTAALRRAAFALDEPLVEGEAEKIAALGWVSPRAQQVWCGSEMRTRETAAALGLDALIAAELADVDYGAWRGMSLDEVEASDPEGLMAWLTDAQAAPHGGESLAQLMVRVERWMAQQTGAGHTIAVSHPAVIRAAVVCAMQAPAQSFWRVEIAPLSLTDLRYGGRFWNVRSSGCAM